MAALANRDRNEDYALDTEFTSGTTYRTELSLVQLGWRDRILLLDPYSVDLTVLDPLFAGEGTALLHAAASDLDLLAEAVGRRPRRLYDTQLAGQFLGMSTPSLAYLVQRYHQIALDKSLQRTDWTVRPLRSDVRHYAASDVAYLHDLADALSGELRELGRLEWLEHECATLLAHVATETPPEELWWRLSRATSISAGRQLGAQRLCVMRDERARRRNRPPSHVLHDDVVVALASKPPATLHELKRLKGCASIPDAFGLEILELLQQAKADSPAELRRLPGNGLDAELEPLVNVLSAWATQRASELEVDFKILATRKDVTDLVAGNEHRLDAPWRREVLTDDLRALREGRAHLVVDNDRVAVRRTA